ncbi:MAG: hypothetical protein NVS9B15_20440 [Acidobacteriaceae bacterium]
MAFGATKTKGCFAALAMTIGFTLGMRMQSVGDQVSMETWQMRPTM